MFPLCVTPTLGGPLSTAFSSLLSPSSRSLPRPRPSHGALPLPHAANLFLLISSILGSRTAGPHTQFVQWFMEECVGCLEQGSRGSILQFMPFTTVSAACRPGGGWWGRSSGQSSGWGGGLLPPKTPHPPQGSLSAQLSSVCLWQVSELVKVSAMSSPKVVLAITDLSLPLGRQVAARAIAAL